MAYALTRISLGLIALSDCLRMECVNDQCQNSFINCKHREDCFIHCAEDRSCVNAVVNCPVAGDCTVMCFGQSSCDGITIDATRSIGSLNVLCKSATTNNQCSGATIYGSVSPSPSNTGQMVVYCGGQLNSCTNMMATCPDSSDCTVSCDGTASCRHSRINGPGDAEIAVNCNGAQSCLGALVDGQQSDKLSITGCSASKSCLDLSVLCPLNQRGTKNCIIENENSQCSPMYFELTGLQCPPSPPPTAAVTAPPPTPQPLTVLTPPAPPSPPTPPPSPIGTESPIAGGSLNYPESPGGPELNPPSDSSEGGDNIEALQTVGGELMIIAGLTLVVLTCLCVGWAKIRKEQSLGEGEDGLPSMSPHEPQHPRSVRFDQRSIHRHIPHSPPHHAVGMAAHHDPHHGLHHDPRHHIAMPPRGRRHRH